jgi:hydrogenase maturation protease
VADAVDGTDTATAPGEDGPGGIARSVTVIGVGNALRGDDAVGLHAARRVRAAVASLQPALRDRVAVLEHEDEPLGLIDRWDGAYAVVLIDALSPRSTPGSIRRFDVSTAPVPARMVSSTSTHAIGVGETIELAREVGRLPARVVLHGVEGSRFDVGGGLSDEVRAAVGEVAAVVLREACELAR